MLLVCFLLLVLCLFCLILGDDKFEEEEEDDDDDDNKENEDIKPTISKKAKLGTSSTFDGGDMNEMIYLKRQPWMPTHTMAVWENDRLCKMVTVAIALDAGVDAENDVNVMVSDDGKELQIKQKMVERLADVNKLHEYFRLKDRDQYPTYHPKIIAFHKYMKSMRKDQRDSVFQSASIKLPFQVQTYIHEEVKMGDKEGARLVYVDLRAVVTESYTRLVSSSLKMVN